ncbi:MAG: hypothetical protein K2M42_08570 [Oscillospiraceae bacterium]|nr:hypothetical protein [Oscillospiraceae bacterium]
MNPFKRFIVLIFSLIASLYGDLLDRISDAIEEGNIRGVSLNILFIVMLTAFLLLSLFCCVVLITKHLVLIVVVSFVAAGIYSFVHGADNQIRTHISQPTLQDYTTVSKILSIAAKRVAPALGLDTIYEETDIKVKADERIVKKGKFWWMKYRLLKKNVSVVIDCAQAQRILQRAVEFVLDTENPGGYDKLRAIYGGVPECVIQLDLPTDSDEYLYVSCTFASDAYFDEKYGNSDAGENDGEVYDDEA